MGLADRGFEVLKFFPAAAAGGPSFLKSLASPLPKIDFCPTGGIGPKNAAEYLRLPNVLTVGGSWVAPKAMVVRLGGKRVPDLAIAGGNYLLWFVVTAGVAWLLLGA